MAHAAEREPAVKAPRRRPLRRALGGGFRALDALALVAFVPAYAARYLPADLFWWADLLAIGLPYLALALLATTTLILARPAWRRRRVVVGLHVAVVVLVLVRFVPAERLAPAEAAPDDLRVMTFNVPPWWGFHAGPKTTHMLNLVRAVDPDLMALQEVTASYKPDGFTASPYVQALADSLGYRTSGPRLRQPLHTSQAVFGRVEIVEHTEQVLRRGPSDATGMRVGRTHVRWQGRDAVLYNLHLRTYGEDKPWQAEDASFFDVSFWLPYLRQYEASFTARAWEVEQVNAMLRQERLPVIVAGDFNSTQHNRTYRRLRRGLDLTDAFAAAGWGWGATYHSRLPLVRIDFLLAGPEWVVTSAGIPDEVAVSDHRPVVATLRWRDGAAAE